MFGGKNPSIFAFAYFLFKKKADTDTLSEDIINKLNQKFPEIPLQGGRPCHRGKRFGVE